ncbi:MAG: 8-oxoguanine deaminase [Chloroflexi bacterium]|nr:MAG: 8-oxoguanine deaminase [Chloroflexota bacterium]MBL1196705.1 8-oxoguanine deaminase [Chloroflexota bacterium]NOH13998.1 8-oxoguanine deaminase [Chloroflexota bacterium]
MSTLLIKNANVLVTMNENREEIRNGAVLVENNQIQWVGASADVDRYIAETRPDIARDGFDEVIDASGCVVLPGLVNCHHHLYQTLTRATGTGEGKVLFDWLKFLYPIWAEMTPEAVYVSAQIGISELVLSGCTTVADHLYMYPNGSKMDDEIRAAQEIGVRFHPTRGSISIGESQGGLSPDHVCDSEPDIIKDCIRLIEAFHDPEPLSMLRIGLAPSALFEVTADLMRESVELARQHPLVNLHTHLGETKDEERFCLETFGKRPVEYAEWCNWAGEDVWFAHMVHPNEADIDWLAKTNSGVCHCPNSNMILASGIAPIREMVDKNVRVGLGVDGSASNDGNHLLGEARQAMLLQRVGWPGFESSANRFTAREALELATIGGAQVLRRNDIGVLVPGMAADIVAFRVDGLEHAGGQSDPVASLITCAPTQVWLSVINGRVIVKDSQFLPLELKPLVERHNRISIEMMERAGVSLAS